MGLGFANQRLGVNIAAGTTLGQTGTVMFSNSNGVSFGMSLNGAGSWVVTASAAGGAAISAGSTQLTSGTALFADSNGFQFGINGQTLTVQHTTPRYFDSPGERNAQMAMVQGVLSYQRFSIPYPLAVTQIDVIRHLTVVGSTANSYSFAYGIYSFGSGANSSLASLMTCLNGAFNVTMGAALNVTFNSGTNTNAASIYGGNSGTRFRSFSIPSQTWFLTPGEYLFAFGGSFTGVAGTTGSITLFGRSAVSVLAVGGGNYSAYWGEGTVNNVAGSAPPGMTLGGPGQTGSQVLGQPYFRLIGAQ